MVRIRQIGQNESKYQGNNFQIVHKRMLVDGKEKVFEEAHRAPGTRSIILSEDRKKILLTKEHRHQLGKVDIRLPGGKVFDSLAQYLEFMSTGVDIIPIAEMGARNEVLEETGYVVDEIKFLERTKCGGMTEWDLFYFLVTKAHLANEGQKLGAGEEITTEWVDVDEVIRLCLNGEIKEDRSTAVLIRFIHAEFKII